MINKYIVTYELDGVTYNDDGYAPNKEIVKAHFEIRYKGIKIVSIKKAK